MADIRLQDYVAKIKEMIRSVRLDEAIAHCQHILRHHPKHVETYSLLGEACLEKQMYREAIEFFQRTLGADPENLMARVGLGVIYDEQGAFPEAIWQLERAFELVPGNSEVRRELLRLYGQYDDIDKTRLKLTRGALGRLYSRNGLYERAIGEFHAVLRQDPELPDIRVALVEALWREGRQLEAVETSMELLDALPNCLKANLILGEIWLRGGNEESAEQRLSVARALDPENRVAQELMGSNSPLPPEKVFIPELDAVPDEFEFAPEVPGAGAVVVAGAAEMAAAEGPGEEDLAPWGTDEELPEWLRDVGVTAEEPALELVADEADLEPPPDEALPAEDIPEWLQEVMGEEGVPPVGEPPPIGEGEVSEFVGEEGAPELLQEAESPDLAQAGLAAGAAIAAGLMVAGMADEEDQEPSEDEQPSEAIPEWLEELVGEAGPSEGEEPEPEEDFAAPVVAESVEEEIPSVEEESLPDKDAPETIPDWVGTLGVAGAAGVAALSLAGDEEDAAPEDDASFAGEALPDGEVPDLVEELDTIAVEDVGAIPVVEAEGEPGALEEDLLSDDEIPDWLRDLGVAEVVEADEPPVPGDEAEVETDVLPALPVAEDDLDLEPPVFEEKAPPDDESPAWLGGLGTAATVGVAGAAALALTRDEEEAPPDAEAPAAEELADEELAGEELVGEALAGEELVGEEPDEIPDWLRDLDSAAAEDVAGPAVVEAVVEAEEEPWTDRDVLAVEESAGEALAGEAPDEIPDWLRDLDRVEAEGAAEPVLGEDGEPSAVAEEVPLIDEIPDWLRDLDKVEVEEVSAPPMFGDQAEVEEVAPEGAVPASLLALVAAGLLDESDLESAMAEMSDEELEAQRAEDVPEWLSELVEEDVPAEREPTIEEIPTPVLEMPVEEEPPVAGPEAVLIVEEAVAEIFEPEPEAEAAAPVEEVVPEIFEPEPEAEAAAPVEEVVPEIFEPEPEAEAAAPVEEAVAEIFEPEPEAEAAAPVEDVVPEVIELEEALVAEEAVLEVAEEEIAAPAREDDLLQQLTARPRDYTSRLELARLYYDQQDWDAALANYEKLISARRFLPDIVADLESLAEQDVDPSRVYHMLGDAYMQQDQLDEALEMYRLARQSLTKR